MQLRCLKCGFPKLDNNFQVELITQFKVIATFVCEKCKAINYVGYPISHVYDFYEPKDEPKEKEL